MKRSINHSLYVITLFGVLLINSGCIPQPTIAQQHLQGIGASIASVDEEMKQCSQAVLALPEYDLLKSRLFMNYDNVSLDQMTDETKASKREIQALQVIHPQWRACQASALNKISAILPSVAAISNERTLLVDSVTAELIKRKISWGEYTSRRRAIEVEIRKKYAEEEGNIITRLQQQHNAEVTQRQVEEAQRRAAFANMMQFYQNQQIINQNQQAIDNANMPVITNCNRFGSSINCISH